MDYGLLNGSLIDMSYWFSNLVNGLPDLNNYCSADQVQNACDYFLSIIVQLDFILPYSTIWNIFVTWTIFESTMLGVNLGLFIFRLLKSIKVW